MIAVLLAGLVAATGLPASVIAPLEDLGIDEAVYLAVDQGCLGIGVEDALGVAVAHGCVALGADESVAVLTPDAGWPTEGVIVRTAAASFPLAVTAGVATPAVVAVPVGRTITSEGVSFRVCHDGVVAQVARADAAPADPGAGAVVERGGVAWFGVADGSWPEAGPTVAGTFWFRVWGPTGEPSAWASDTVELVGEGRVRADVRFGYDLAAGRCPDPDSEWAIGEEGDVEGAPVVDPPSEDDDGGRKGCGGGSGAWFGLPLAFFLRRRYQTSSGSNAKSSSIP